jgi:peptidoglycan hydrolase-like protein with peptidoglycan-binding domain
MLLARKIGWARIAFTLLAIAILIQGFPRSAGESDSNQQGEAVFVIKNEITKMQETLRNKGHYRGKADGALGLRTRASIRAYQKAENLPITGEVDLRTADGLGVRPESSWDPSKNAGREVGRNRAGGETRREKPSAGIRRAEGRTIMTSRKEVSKASAPKDNRGASASKQQATNEKHNP